MKIIKVNSPKYGIKEVLLDDEDYEFLIQWKWGVKQRAEGHPFYVQRNKRKDELRENQVNGNILIHRVIMNVTNPKIMVDHIDHNPLNNQKSNLRACSQSDNLKNKKAWGSSKYLGVSLHKKIYKPTGRINYYWTTSIITNKGRIFKLFPYTPKGEILAAKYYDELATKYHKKFAHLNFKIKCP